MLFTAVLLAIAHQAGAAMQAAHPRTATASPARLRPLSEADLATSTQTGCQFRFMQGDATYMFIIGSDVLIRTADGLSRCTVPDAAPDGFRSAGRAIACGGRRLSLRRVGPAETGPASDSAGGGDAVLTLAQGRARRTIRGVWTTAC